MNKMRWSTLFLGFLAGYASPGRAQETEQEAVEFNRTQFVPLEVGNRWTFAHT